MVSKNSAAYVHRILGDVPGHEFHGNQWKEGTSSEASHPTHPLPDKPGPGGAAYSLKDDREGALDTIVSKQKDGSYYGMTDKFDFSAKTAREMRSKLKSYGATYMGWEHK